MFSSVVLDGLPGCSRSSTVPVSQKRSDVRLIQASVGIFLPNSTCSFRLTTIGDSNLAINRTIFILRLIGTDIYLKVNKIKLKRIYYYFIKKSNLIACVV
jgi:hypothetical protein